MSPSNYNDKTQVLCTIQSLPKEIRNLLAGGIAGMLAKSFVAPIDRIKILYQVTSAQFRLRDVPKVAYSIIEKEGTAALWKGNTATMIRVFPYSGIQFMVFDYCKVYFLNGGSSDKVQRQQNRLNSDVAGKRHLPESSSSSISTQQQTTTTTISHRGTIALPSPSNIQVVGGTNKNKEIKKGLSPIESLVSGMIAGTVSVLCTYPLDLARAQLAVLRKKKKPKLSSVASGVGTLASSSSTTTSISKSNLDKQLGIGSSSKKSSRKGIGYVLSNTFQQNGARGLYRGITPTILGILPYSGVAFTINEQAKRQITHITGRDPTTIERLQCGALSGLFAQTLAYPLEVTRRRMQTIGIVPTSGVDSAVVNFSGVSQVKPSVDELQGAKAIKQAEPQQRIRTTTTSTTHHKPPSMITTMRHLFEEQGIRGFYKGVSMNWVKGPIAFSISFTTFDTIQGWIETDYEREMKKSGSGGGDSQVQIVKRMTNREPVE